MRPAAAAAAPPRQRPTRPAVWVQGRIPYFLEKKKIEISHLLIEMMANYSGSGEEGRRGRTCTWWMLVAGEAWRWVTPLAQPSPPSEHLCSANCCSLYLGIWENQRRGRRRQQTG